MQTSNEDYSFDSTYFENRYCKYYPCHEGKEHINCLFCYCPMYRIDDCPGNPHFIERDGLRIKDCTGCAYPHDKSHYDTIMQVLKAHKDYRAH
ncbi:MAG: cysteine-rich small domain-containing protein [Lachnospiraceae bacterium]|nr:cysteine-rich small domain-containing protein [Lachnospiraceae bacterium]